MKEETFIQHDKVLAVWKRKHIVYETKAEKEKSGFEESWLTVQESEIPFKDIFEYMHKYWFELMYKPDIRDMMRKEPEILDSRGVIDKFVEKFYEAATDLAKDPKYGEVKG